MVAFNFSSETPPESIINDFQTLNKFELDKFEQLSNVVIQFLTEPSKSDRLLSQLDDFSKALNVSAGALKNVFKSFLNVPYSALRKSMSSQQIKEDLVNLGLEEEKVDYFCKQWDENISLLSRSAVFQTLMVNQLVDMEWKFGVTAASSELNSVGNTFLQLKLVINKGNHTENVFMEMSLPQFYSFLHEMEKAKSSLEYFM